MLVSSTESTLHTNVTTVSTVVTSATTREYSNVYYTKFATNFFSLMLACNLKFEPISIIMPESYDSMAPIVIGDFNNDNHQDIAYTITNNFDGVAVILGNENGTFGEPIITLMKSISLNIYFSTTADFNHDNLLDIVLADDSLPSIRVLAGYGNGTFHEIIFVVDNCSDGIYGASIGNLNNDEFLDFTVVCLPLTSIVVIFGNANGTFAQNIIVNNFIRINIQIMLIRIADVNNDNYGDLIVVNSKDCSINTFLGSGNGSFDTPKISLISRNIYILSALIDDFNNDKKQDVVFMNLMGIGLMFGYNDGTFDVTIKLKLKGARVPDVPLAASDFNGDGYLDLVITTYYPYTVIIHFGDGNGNFELYTIFESEISSYNKYIAAIDFNSDGYQDIFTVSYFGVYIFLNTGQCNNESEIFETSTSITQYTS